MEKNKPKYEYYCFRIILFTFIIIETISLGLFLSGFLLDIFLLFILGIVGIVFGLYVIIANITVTLLFLGKTKKNQKLIDKIITSLEIRGDEKVLDAGCGRGFFSNLIAKRLDGGKVIGVDIADKILSSENVIKHASENAFIEGVGDKTEFIKGDILSLPFKDNTFDVVLCISVLEYFDWKKECRMALKEINRVLKPDGKLLLFEMIRSLRGFFISNPFLFFNLKSKEQWNNVVSEQGFSRVKNFEDRGRLVFIYKKKKSKD